MEPDAEQVIADTLSSATAALQRGGVSDFSFLLVPFVVSCVSRD